MILEELFEDTLEEAKLVYARKGKQIVRKYRCGSGRLAGKTVSNPSACFKPVDIKKRFVLARTKSKMGARMAKKSNATKKLNPASRMLKTLNK